jgi:EAL domain-containing protein (putative c-di-GMP-specific phosphodiesterase class I)
MFIDNDPGGFLFLNLHPETLCSPNFSPPAVLDFLQEIGMSPSRIILEVLEDWRETELSEIQLALDPFVDEGLQFALDDFVVSSEDMKRWTGLRPNLVKFDRSLVHGVADDQSRQRPLLAFESKAGRSNTLLLYEGVETMADADWLRENTRIPLCQGYYFSRPAPIGLAEPAAPQSSLPQILNQTGTRQMEKECA